MSASDDKAHLIRASEQLAQAEELRRGRKFDKAESICAALLRNDPDFFGARYTLGLIHADRDDPAKALPHLLRAAMSGPHNAQAYIALAGVLIESHAPDLAAQILTLAERRAPHDTTLIVTQGEIAHRQGRYRDAIGFFARALAHEPGFTEAGIGVARAHFSLGEFEAGTRILESLIAQGQASADLLFTLAQAPARFITADLLALSDRAQQGLPPSDKSGLALLDFTRAAALDRAGDHAGAWARISAANARIFPERRAQAKALEQKQADALAELTRQGHLATPASDPQRPVALFVMGPSRSGKSVMERLLAGAPGVAAQGERSILSEAIRWTFQAAGMADMFPLRALPPALHGSLRDKFFQLAGEGARVITFTNPLDVLHLPAAMQIIPNLRVIGLSRNRHDLALRILMTHYEAGNGYAYDLAATLEHIRRYGEILDALARACPDAVRLLSYEDIVASPAAALQAAADLTGLEAAAYDGPPIGDDRHCAAPYLPHLS